MTIRKIVSPSDVSSMVGCFNDLADEVYGFSTSFSTDELIAPVIKGDDIITLTSDPTNGTGVVMITPDAFTYKDSNSNVKNIGFKEDDYYSIGDTVSGYKVGAWGHLTSSKAHMFFSFPLDKKIPSNATIDITSFVAQIRGAGGTITVSSLSALDSLGINEDYSHGSTALVSLTSSTLFASGTNNECYEALLTLNFDIVAATS